MTYETIDNLIEKLSLDMVFADPADPDSLSGLLPVLKQIHSYSMKRSWEKTARMVLKAKKIIDSILKKKEDNAQDSMTALNELISNLSLSINKLKQNTSVSDETSEPKMDDLNSDESTPVSDQAFDQLKELASLVRQFCPGDIPDLGKMLNLLDELIQVKLEKNQEIFQNITNSCKAYVEYMTLESSNDTHPVEEAIILLKSILTHEEKRKEFSFDTSDVIKLLQGKLDKPKIQESQPEPDDGIEENEPVPPEPPAKETKKSEPPPPEKSPAPSVTETPMPVSEDDMEILVDFIAEARENLDSIEINLIELEQEPENKDIINDIFRPFHTIKGVSGFLSLTKINKLAHTTENFLDSARNGDFIIEHTATDAILESVDVLKKLIDKVEQGSETGVIPTSEELDIETLSEKLKKLQAALANGETPPFGEILVQKGDITSEDLEKTLEKQKKSPDKKIGEILTEEKKITPGQAASALVTQNKMKTQAVKQRTAAQVKVSTQKLDDLVDYAGELVIAQSMLRQKTAQDSSLSQNVSQLGQIVTNMQHIAMSMRMIPIKATFMKMIRLVRDLSRKSGKEIQLIMEGEETEIDRNVVDALYEPMVHMIRNSCDHGIEEKQIRGTAGKPASGTIVLRAYHKGGHITIEIEDDGKGLDKDVILEKAISKGLLTGNEQLTDAQIFDLIMKPGFSTAKTVTDVSGRGVGMDVVKSGIEKFRGQLKIESEKGRGSKFTISLPLTLAIIDGMLVRVENEKYVIPTIVIEKVFKPDASSYYTVEGKGEMIKDRNRLLPLIRPNVIFKHSDQKKQIEEGIIVLVESKDEKRALLVDELLGKDEYVIKSLGTSLENLDGLAGGAILSDGKVGLILDIEGIFQLASK